ncbi:MAG TPA: hypothetical protein VJO34_14340 [Methylomirabilota bacterium]|nr:hypothetical protein [Methylomirabilota bacterium]
MDEGKGFELALETIDVIIEDESRGKRYELRHTFRQPSDADWIEYRRIESAYLLRNSQAMPADPMAAELRLWETCIQRVDDQHLWEGEPVMKREDWKQKIPRHYKYLAVRALLAVRHQVLDGPSGLRAALRAVIRAARQDEAAWGALDEAMGLPTEEREPKPWLPWVRFIDHLAELDRRRGAGLLRVQMLTWLETEGLMILDEERRRAGERA